MSLKLGFTLFLFLLLVELPGILSRKCHKGGHRCKVHENSPIPVDLPRLCGDNIIDVYKNICHKLWVRRRRRRETDVDLLVQTKHEANDFLSFRRRKRSTHSTDVIEECCGERCRTEELKEYC